MPGTSWLAESQHFCIGPSWNKETKGCDKEIKSGYWSDTSHLAQCKHNWVSFWGLYNTEDQTSWSNDIFWPSNLWTDAPSFKHSLSLSKTGSRLGLKYKCPLLPLQLCWACLIVAPLPSSLGSCFFYTCPCSVTSVYSIPKRQTPEKCKWLIYFFPVVNVQILLSEIVSYNVTDNGAFFCMSQTKKKTT